MADDNRALIVGGYGQVGQVVAARLAEHFPAQVLVGGRDHVRAAALASCLPGQVGPRQIDLARPEEWEVGLRGVRIAIVCVEQKNVAFARACLERGIHYVDISASDELLQPIEALHTLAQQRGATAILSVGLTPGLTNVLARSLSDRFEAPEAIEICVLLGLGDLHGPDAVRWTLQRAARSFTVGTAQGRKTVRGFDDPRSFQLPAPYGRRRAYRFDFADQHALGRTLGVAAATRLCFDSAAATRVLALLGRLGLLPLLGRLDSARITKLLHRLPFGSDRFVVQVEVTGTREGCRSTLSARASGRAEAHATGVVAALAAEHLLTATVRPGVLYHLDQLVPPGVLLGWLPAEQITLSLDERGEVPLSAEA